MSTSHSRRSHLSHTDNPLSLPQGPPSYDDYEEEDDDISELTFDRSAFDTSIYTRSRHEEGHALELTEKNVRRFGARKGYAPALSEDSQSGMYSDSQSDSAMADERPIRYSNGDRRPLTSKDIMIRELARRQVEASTFNNRLYSISTLLILAQVVVMGLMIREGGILPLAKNMMLGPDVGVMLDYGAQQGGFVIYENQEWRLLTAMFVHAGLIHLACNVYVQWQVGGYLCVLWGKFSYLLVFLLSGVAGNAYSVIRSPDLVGVGSSGGVMGVLAAWAMFLVLTWDLVAEADRPERNKQLCSLIVNIVIVIVIGQLEFVDGNAHLGGMIQGALLGTFLLSDESSSINLKWFLRTVSLGAMILLYLWVVLFAWREVEPSEEVLLQYE